MNNVSVYDCKGSENLAISNSVSVKYKEKLGHLNLSELAFVLGMDLEVLLSSIAQQKELLIRDIPIIITYGDLCVIQREIYRAASILIDMQKQPCDAAAKKKASDSTGELLRLFNYVDSVLMDGNITKEAVNRMDPSIAIPK